MPTVQQFHQAQLRHAIHYVTILSSTNELYEQGGQSIKEGLDLSDLELANIRIGQNWAEVHADENDTAAQLCIYYPVSSIHYLDLRLHPHELIHWLETALTFAQRLNELSA
jgi:hypothetical protein